MSCPLLFCVIIITFLCHDHYTHGIKVYVRKVKPLIKLAYKANGIILGPLFILPGTFESLRNSPTKECTLWISLKNIIILGTTISK